MVNDGVENITCSTNLYNIFHWIFVRIYHTRDISSKKPHKRGYIAGYLVQSVKHFVATYLVHTQ